MKEEKNILKQILEDKNLDENIPVFFRRYCSVNYMYAGMEFVIQYYNLYESIKDAEVKLDAEADDMLKEINQFIKRVFLDENIESERDKINIVDGLRNQVMDKMNLLTVYSDKFLIYEHVLAKMQYFFDELIEDIDVDYMNQEIIAGLYADKDQVVVNEKIKELVYQLPIRMTKNKFYDLIENSILMYVGQDCSSVDDFIYMIKTSAGMQTVDTESVYNFEEQLKEFSEVDYKEIDQKEYENLLEKLNDVSTIIIESTEVFYQYQELLNSLYAMILNEEYADIRAKEFFERFIPLLVHIFDGFQNEYPDVDDDAYALFEMMEGKLEEYAEKNQNYQFVFEKVEESNHQFYERYRQSDQYHCLRQSSKLLSSSLFIDLHKVESYDIADKKYIEEKWTELMDTFSKHLAEQPKLVNRAMIASVLKELPVFFTDSKSLLDYVKTSLTNCHNIAEKKASYDAIMDYFREMKAF